MPRGKTPDDPERLAHLNELFALVKSPDERTAHMAFDVLYKEFSPPVFSYIYRLVGNEQDAEECLQEASIRAWKYRHVPADWIGMRKYLFTIAGNVVSDFWNKKNRGKSQQPPAGSLADSSANVESKTDQAHAISVLKRAFSRLSPRQRQCVFLAKVKGIKHKVIAEMLGIKVSTVRWHIREGMGRLDYERILLGFEGQDSSREGGSDGRV